MLALAHTNPVPIRLGLAGAALALQLADRAVTAAHLAMLDAPPGEMLAYSEAWHAAERKLARAALRERAERFRARGQRHLKAVPA